MIVLIVVTKLCSRLVLIKMKLIITTVRSNESTGKECLSITTDHVTVKVTRNLKWVNVCHENLHAFVVVCIALTVLTELVVSNVSGRASNRKSLKCQMEEEPILMSTQTVNAKFVHVSA